MADNNSTLTLALRAAEKSEPLNAPFAAGITHSQVRLLEYGWAASDEIVRKRRLVMLALAYGSEQLLAMRVDNPALYRQMASAVFDVTEYARTLDAMARSATARLALTGHELRAGGVRLE